MTIRRGEDWGTVVTRPVDARIATTDAELAEFVAAGDGRPVVVSGGDVFRTLGSPTAGASALCLPVDLISVEAGGMNFTAIAHVVLRRPGRLGWWRGPLVAAMNAQYVGRWDVAPRAHPNDGRFDAVVVDESMGPRARWQARRRLPTGSHVPHPAISVTRQTDATYTFDRPVAVFVDGVRCATAATVSIRLDPDAATVYA